jgi:hypothetical protein
MTGSSTRLGVSRDTRCHLCNAYIRICSIFFQLDAQCETVFLRDFRLSPQCKWCLRSVDWSFVNDVSGQTIGPIFKCQAVFYRLFQNVGNKLPFRAASNIMRTFSCHPHASNSGIFPRWGQPVDFWDFPLCIQQTSISLMSWFPCTGTLTSTLS